MKSVWLADAAWVNGREMRLKCALVAENGILLEILSQEQLPGQTGDLELHRARLLLPGFINMHCHLEYGGLCHKLPGGEGFVSWLRAMVGLKRGLGEEDYEAAAREGIAQLLAGGTTTLVESAQSLGPARALADSPLRYWLLWELLAFGDQRAGEAMAQLAERLAMPRGERCLGFGVNPHAPYTVGQALRRQLRAFLQDHPETLCAWHLGEMPEELELLETGSGELADFLGGAGLPAAFPQPPGCSPVEALDREGLLGRCEAAFHLNHFVPGEAARFAAPRALVHCPATHAYFAREPFALGRAFEEGANVCLGTDSLASADTLSMFEILRRFGCSHPELSGAQLLALATTGPGRSLFCAGWAGPLGVLAKGACADFVSIEVDGSLTRKLRELLLAPDAYVGSTYIAGKKVF